VLTSNRTRDLHDAVKRRCLYQWIDYPTPQREVEIVRRRVKGASETLAVQVGRPIGGIRAADVQKPPGIAEAIDWLAALETARRRAPRRRRARPHARLGAQVRRGPGGRPRGRPRAACRGGLVSDRAFRVETVELDVPALAASFGRRLHDAGVPTTAERSVRFAEALSLVRPVSRRRLYWTARATLVSDATQVRAFDAVFREVFGSSRADEDPTVAEDARTVPVPPDERKPAADRRHGESDAPPPAGGASTRPPGDGAGDDDLREVAVPVAASDEERLRTKRFDALEPGELARLYHLMSRSRSPRPSAARAAPTTTAAASTSTCGGRCAAACAPPATRSASRAGAGASCRGAS
jgi:hypothetical protein